MATRLRAFGRRVVRGPSIFDRTMIAACVWLFALQPWTECHTAESPALPLPARDDPSGLGPIDTSAVSRFGPAWKYPRAGWCLVHIEGEPYERGYQHGRLLAAEIVDYLRTLATARSAQSPQDAWKQYRLLVQALFLKRFHPEYLEEMKGIADGAADAGAEFDERRLDWIDIAAINADVEATFMEEAVEVTPTGIDAKRFARPRYATPMPRRHERCSAFIANGDATRDGRIVLGHITMTDLRFARHYNIWLEIRPAAGHRIVMQTFPGSIQSGLDYYLCSSGLVIAETTLPQTHFNSEGMLLASRIRHAAQYANSIDDVVAMLQEANNGLYTNEWLLGDLKTNEIAMFELGTRQTRLWRGSRNEWFSGTAGFYWGCNNTKDQRVLAETIPDLAARPGNLVLAPHRRDAAWLNLFRKRQGGIDASFGFEAFSTPPLVGYPSCDAKFTTADLAKRLESWALFGPPLGRTWTPSAEDRELDPAVKSLVANDWTLLRLDSPPAAETGSVASDLEPFPGADENAKPLEDWMDKRHPFAWRGTLLPEDQGDVWLAAAFCEYERIVALEQSLRQKWPEEELPRPARDLLETALFGFESRAYAAERRSGDSVSIDRASQKFDDLNWFPIVVGKGVGLLDRLRRKLGSERFNRLMDEFGTRYAGQKVTTRKFLEFDPALTEILTAEYEKERVIGKQDRPEAPFRWSLFSFEDEPERARIVYGTLRDGPAQREAAELLQRSLARRFHNVWIPMRSDSQVTPDELSNNHILLVGGPETNRVAAQWRGKFAVRFGASTIEARDQCAHPESWVIAAGRNGKNDRYSSVIFAGLSAQATWECVQQVPANEQLLPQVILQPHGRPRQSYCLADRPAAE